MEDFNDIDAIGPYRTDEEAQDACRHISENPLLEKISLYFFPEESGDYLKNILKIMTENKRIGIVLVMEGI